MITRLACSNIKGTHASMANQYIWPPIYFVKSHVRGQADLLTKKDYIGKKNILLLGRATQGNKERSFDEEHAEVRQANEKIYMHLYMYILIQATTSF